MFKYTSSILLSVCLLAAGVFAQKAKPAFVDGEVLVRYKNGVSAELIQTTNSAIGFESIEKLGDLGWHRVKLDSRTTVQSAIAKFQVVESVEAAQPNFYYYLQATPNDPDFTLAGMYGLSKISAPQAWDITTGSTAVVVANIDTGIRYTHEDLAPNMWVNPGEIPNNGIDDEGNGFIDDVYGYDFRFNDSDPYDEHGHGTHTSGTIGARGNNGLGVVGVNWNVRLMAIKIYSAGASDTTSAMLINAYNYIRMMKGRGVNIRVTNNSYGGCTEACDYDQATKDAIDAMGDADILNVFAAGNSGVNIDNTPFYPASYASPSILAVGATNVDDNRAFNFGLNSVDLAAPGISIRSTMLGSDSSYGNMSGTSMATPHVSGAAALLAGNNPSLSAASLKATLMNTADAVPQWNGFSRTGGRLNVFAALQNQTVCSFSFGPQSILVPTKGGQYNIAVTAPPNCDFSLKSSKNWIVLNGAKNLSGGGEIKFTVRINNTIRRTGTINIGGQILTITQSRNGIL
ncbi:MAG: S8 family serine peptidase [Pyrinomonadaceae bacterium]